MSAISIFRGFLVCCILGLLTACGGGGGSGGTTGSGFTNPQNITVSISSSRTTLPANRAGNLPALGSPFTTEVLVTAQNADGSPIANGTTVQMSLAPVSTGGLSTLDDPTTTPRNEFIGCDVTTDATTGALTITNCSLSGSIPTQTASGQAQFFFTSAQPGVATLTATVQDPNSGRLVSAALTINVVGAGGGTGQAANIAIQAPTTALFIQGVSAAHTAEMVITVTDGSGQLVADPAAGVNNVLVEILPGSPGGVTLQGTDAAGNPVQGSSIKVRTLSGITTVNLSSGTEPGIAIVRATSDSDNNVDNGVAAAISAQVQVPISDGRLFSLAFTGPFVDAVRANQFAITSPPGTFLNGTYSLIVSVIGTDRFGNPVLPGTPIQFGLIDDPLSGFPSCGGERFDICGTNGDPSEGGTLFTALGANFLGAGLPPQDKVVGGDQGDQLITGLGCNASGALVQGGLPFQIGSRLIATVNGPDTLTVSQAFNPGTDTGPTVPFTIGRPTQGNISTPATTDANGVATTTMNYPVTALDRPVILTAQGTGNQVGAVFAARYAAIASDATRGTQTALTVVPTSVSVLSDTTVGVGFTLVDAESSPMPDVVISPSVATTVTGNITNAGSVGVINRPSCCTDLAGHCNVTLQVNVCVPNTAATNVTTTPVTVTCTSTSTVTWIANGTNANQPTTVVTTNGSATVQPPPTVTLTAIPASITEGQSSTLVWSSNSRYCLYCFRGLDRK